MLNVDQGARLVFVLWNALWPVRQANVCAANKLGASLPLGWHLLEAGCNVKTWAGEKQVSEVPGVVCIEISLAGMLPEGGKEPPGRLTTS